MFFLAGLTETSRRCWVPSTFETLAAYSDA